MLSHTKNNMALDYKKFTAFNKFRLNKMKIYFYDKVRKGTKGRTRTEDNDKGDGFYLFISV